MRISFSIVRSLRHRDFRLFFSGQLISLIGTWAQKMAQAWLVYEMTSSPAWLGVVEAINNLPMFFFSLIGGSIADKFPKRRLLIILQSAAMLQAFVYTALIWSHKINIGLIAVLSLIQGLIVAFEVPARQSYYVELVGEEDLTNAIALNSAGFNMGRLTGPAIGGMLVARFGVGWCMLVNGISFIAVILSLFFIRKAGLTRKPSAQSSMLRSLRQVFAYIQQARAVKALLLLVATTTVFGWSYIVIMPVFAKEIFGGGAVELGKLMSAAGLGSFLSAMLVAAVSDRILPRKLVFAALIIFTSAVVGLVFVSDFSFALVAVCCVGFGLVMFYINANSALQRRIPNELRGRIMGVYALAFGGLMPLGSLQIGFLAEHFGVRRAIFIGVVILSVVAAMIGRWVTAAPTVAKSRPAEHKPVDEIV